jgi:hypothetical protein
MKFHLPALAGPSRQRGPRRRQTASVPFTKCAVEFISTKITKITECRLADLYAEFPNAKTWVSSFGLMVIFANQPREEMRPFALQFVRRVEMVLSEYSSARNEIQDLVSGNPRWSPYYRALHHVEAAVALLYQAYEFSRNALGQQRLFEKNDGSPLQRLNFIYGSSKHERAKAEDSVWLSNEGINAIKRKYGIEATVRLDFPEFEELALRCARIAERLTTTT